jgi:hypothetical protein
VDPRRHGSLGGVDEGQSPTYRIDHRQDRAVRTEQDPLRYEIKGERPALAITKINKSDA